jgi:ribosomal protein L21E
MNEERLRNLFYGAFKGVVNPQRLYAAAKRDPLTRDYTLSAIQDFIRNQETVQRFRRLNPKPYFVPIIGRPWQYQADLMFFDRGSLKIPILIVIELTSRRAYGRIMPNKEATTTAASMRDIITQIRGEHLDIKSVEHDAGSEFRGAFITLLNQEGIEDIRFPRGEASKTALGKINVFIRTLRVMMEKADTNFGGDWRETLPDLLRIYNGTPSTSTDMAPDTVTTDDQFNYIRTLELSRNPGARPRVDRYKVGAKVRKLIEMDIFKKRSRPRFSKEIYTIASRQGNSFTLQDKDGDPVMSTNLKGEEHLNPEVRLFRAWELLPVEADKVQSVPSELTEDTQRLTDKEARQANAVNRERNKVDAPPIVQETPAPELIEQAANAPRQPRARKQTEKAAQAADTEALLKQATRKQKALPGKDDLVEVLRKVGDKLEVQWKDGSRSVLPLSHFLIPETGDYHPLVKAFLRR